MKKPLLVAMTLVLAFCAGAAFACPLNANKNDPPKSTILSYQANPLVVTAKKRVVKTDATAVQ
jgi:hypothetical protein